jgi:DNA-binding winged helix-turn-helix (wHTH) protein
MTRFGSFEFDAGRRLLLRAGREVHLSPKAFDLLTLLVEAAPRVVPKSELYARLWPRVAVSDATLVGLIKELRRALGNSDTGAPLIRTANRIGYALDIPPSQIPLATRAWRWLVASGRRVQLGEGENSIGREPQSTLQLDHATVSRHHARITVSGDGAVLEDLGSKNGTRVGATPIRGPVCLHNGDRVAFGKIVVTYRESIAGLSTATQRSRIVEPASNLEQ